MQITKLFFSGILLTIILTTHSAWHSYRKEFILVLDPSGDAKKTGRSIGDSFERGLTLQCAEKIKTIIEEKYSHVKVIITRLPGDIVYDLQNASLSNRINADLFISLNFYLTTETKPTLFLYQFSYGNDFVVHQPGLTFLPYDQVYKINKQTTDAITQLCATHVTNNTYHSFFTFSGPHALPIKPLIGITAPSIAFEGGIKNKDLWYIFIEPITNAIVTIIEKI